MALATIGTAGARWQITYDSISSFHYYFENPKTGETTWDFPRA